MVVDVESVAAREDVAREVLQEVPGPARWLLLRWRSLQSKREFEGPTALRIRRGVVGPVRIGQAIRDAVPVGRIVVRVEADAIERILAAERIVRDGRAMKRLLISVDRPKG